MFLEKNHSSENSHNLLISNIDDDDDDDDVYRDCLLQYSKYVNIDNFAYKKVFNQFDTTKYSVW